jgi:PAS domain S-box-containing protein
MKTQAENTATGSPTDSSPKNILLVEDEALIAMAEERLLREEGYEVLLAFNGKTALELLRTSARKIDLVLMDIDLGRGIDGTQVAAEILAEKDLPILFLSSHTDKETVDRTEKITSYGYVVKDSGSIVLLASIKMAFKLHEAHRALRVSEDRYAKAFHTSPDAININRLKDGMFLAINQGFSSTTGYRIDEVIGKSSLSDDLNIWVKEEARQRLITGLKEHGEVSALEAEFRMKDGTIKSGLMSARIIEIGEEQCILSITRDISKEKKVEKQLQKDEELLHVLFETSDDNVMLSSICPDGEPGAFVDVSQSACDTFGYSREEMLKLHPDDIVQSYNRDEIIRVTHRLLTEGRVEYEVLARRKNGTVLTCQVKAYRINAGGRPLILTVSRNITNAGQAEKVRERILSESPGHSELTRELTFGDLFDVKEIQEIQDAFASATGVASIITDPAGVPITSPSSFCYLCQGIIRNTEKGLANCYYSDQVLGKMNPSGPLAQPCLSGGLWDGGTSIQVGDRHIANWLIGQVLEDPIDLEKMLAYGRKIGADEREFAEALSKVTRMPKEQFLKICNALFLIARLLSRLAMQNAQQTRYIADREMAEEALRQMVNQRGVLLQELQHRVKNNLSIISSLLNLELPRLSDVKARQVFVDADNRIRAMTKMYEQLYRSDTLADIELHSYISDLTTGLVANYAIDRERIHVNLNVEVIKIDLKRAVPLGLILNEFISNAMKYAFPDDRKGEIRIDLEKEANIVTLVVSDDGVGMPKEFKAGGTQTLGLVLVDLLVKQLNGTMAIDGKKGTSLVVSFPL